MVVEEEGADPGEYHPRCLREQLVWKRQIQERAGLSHALHSDFELTP